MSKLIVLIGLAFLAVATSALQQEDNKVTPTLVCPTSRPCCSCACIPKGCPEVKRPDHCKRIKCLPVCPHKCPTETEDLVASEIEQDEQKIVPAVDPLVCPTELPCCSCKCVPKGCPTPKRPDHCKFIGHCPVCPHKCQDETEVLSLAVSAVQDEQDCPKTLPCCSCKCLPKGCEPKRADYCKHIHCPVCPHKCSNATEGLLSMVASEVQQDEQEKKITPAIDPPVCPKTLPCCSCRCIPKGCPKPERPEYCKRVGHCPVCPHKCAGDN